MKRNLRPIIFFLRKFCAFLKKQFELDWQVQSIGPGCPRLERDSGNWIFLSLYPFGYHFQACLIAAIVRETMVAMFQEQENRRNYPERVYSVSQASEITGYSKNSLYQMHSQGKVPGAHKVGSKLMFDTAATLREWVEKGGGK